MSGTDDEIEDAAGAPPPQLSIPIDPPIVFQTGSHDVLILKEPTVGQKRLAHEQLRNGTNQATIDLYEIHLISAVSGKPIAVVEKLPVGTLNKAMAYLDYFLDAGRRTTWT